MMIDDEDYDDLLRELSTAKAELAEVEAERDAADKLIADVFADAASNNIRLAEASHRAEAAEARIAHLENHIEGVAKDTHKIMVAYEAALPAVYRLGLDEGANVAASGTSRNDTYSKGRNDAATAICALPTPTAAELMARIQTGEKE